MKSQIKLVTVFGVELELHDSWLIIALLITFSLVAQFHATNPSWAGAVIWVAAVVTGVLFFGGLFAHELSHALVAKARGIPIHHITLFLLGGWRKSKESPRGPAPNSGWELSGPSRAEFWDWCCWRLRGSSAGSLEVVGDSRAGSSRVARLHQSHPRRFNMIPGFPLDGRPGAARHRLVDHE